MTLETESNALEVSKTCIQRVGADPRVCPNNERSLREKFIKNLIQNLSKLMNNSCSIHDNSCCAAGKIRMFVVGICCSGRHGGLPLPLAAMHSSLYALFIFHFSLFTSRLRGYQSSTLPGYASRALRSTTRACSMSSFFKT